MEQATILVVDDEEQIRGLLERILVNLNHSVVCAEDGDIGLEIWHQMRDNIALVITDLRMPNMWGDELIREIRQTESIVKILLLSGDCEEKTALKAGANAFIHKADLNLDILLSTVENFLKA